MVSEEDQVIGSVTQAEMIAQKLLHRIAHIFVFNERGEMALQLRSAKKSFCPLHWSTSVGGHVQTGESYEFAALREYSEELGVTSPLTALGKDRYTAVNGLPIFFMTFHTIHSGPFVINPEEVERVEFFPLEEIPRLLSRGEKFNPELTYLFQKYFLSLS